MSPAINGMTGGTGSGSATWTVTSNNTSGFSLALKASTAPAMQKGTDNFADYTEATAGTPDYTWSVAAADSEFGYTVEPATVADTAQFLKDNGTVCGGSGTLNTANACWTKFTTSDVTVVNRTTATSGTGEAEVVKFQAQSGASHYQPAGTYTATITATATTNL